MSNTCILPLPYKGYRDLLIYFNISFTIVAIVTMMVMTVHPLFITNLDRTSWVRVGYARFWLGVTTMPIVKYSRNSQQGRKPHIVANVTCTETTRHTVWHTACKQQWRIQGCSGAGTRRSAAPANIVYHRRNADTAAFRQISFSILRQHNTVQYGWMWTWIQRHELNSYGYSFIATH